LQPGAIPRGLPIEQVEKWLSPNLAYELAASRNEVLKAAATNGASQ